MWVSYIFYRLFLATKKKKKKKKKKRKYFIKFILLIFVMETQAHTAIVAMQQAPPAAVMQHAGFVQRETVNVSAVRVLGKQWHQCFRMLSLKKSSSSFNHVLVTTVNKLTLHVVTGTIISNCNRHYHFIVCHSKYSDFEKQFRVHVKCFEYSCYIFRSDRIKTKFLFERHTQ